MKSFLNVRKLPRQRAVRTSPKNRFRQRGFHFLHKAGTHRKTVFKTMCDEPAHWMRLWWSTMCAYLNPSRKFPYHHPAELQYCVPLQNPEAFSFVVVGDTGLNSPGEYLVTSAISQQHLYPSEFCLILGDVIYPSGHEHQYTYGLFEAFKHYHKPVLAIPGNHDWYDNLHAFQKFFLAQQSYLRSSRHRWTSPGLPHWYYHMDLGHHVRLICLDTGVTGTMEQQQQAQLHWLKFALDTAEHRKIIVMMHHPLYSLTPYPYEKSLKNQLEHLFEAHNVVALFAGHDHNYQRHTLNGRHYIIQGAGGATLRKTALKRHIRDTQGKSHLLTAIPQGDSHHSFSHIQCQGSRIQITTYSAHDLPGQIIDKVTI